MGDKFLDKYRIPTARAAWWDYASDAAYFITICTAGRNHFFGEITTATDENSIPRLSNVATMQLSEIGKITESEWLKTPSIRPDMNLSLDAFVFMPNHFHAIIIIGENQYNSDRIVNDEPAPGFGPQRKNLASIVRGFKSAVTRQACSIHADFAWQTRLWDHIIRDDEDYSRIKTYIENNPANWMKDQLNPEQQ
jgi:REP element-mobilizing transposase RayT